MLGNVQLSLVSFNISFICGLKMTDGCIELGITIQLSFTLDAAIWVTNKNQDPWSYVFHPLEIPDYLMIQIKAGFLKFDKVRLRCLLQSVNK
jgi:hypothetical protein